MRIETVTAIPQIQRAVKHPDAIAAMVATSSYDKLSTDEQRTMRRRVNRVRNRMKDDNSIIAWDGEGFEENGRHCYALLANSLGLDVRNRSGLDVRQCLDLVWRTGASNPDSLHVMYGAQYDWEHWLHGISQETAKSIYLGHPTQIGRYTVRYNSVWFEVGKGDIWVQVWDLWKFWGCGFEKALRSSFPDFHGLGVISEFKARRGNFSWNLMDEMAAYNRLELEGLVQLTRQLFDDLAIAGVQRPTYLTGSGSLAGALHTVYKTHEHVGDRTYGGDTELSNAIHRGYAGGRVDPWKFGYSNDRIYQHDLRSAYPTAMSLLPSMADGSWEWVSKFDADWDARLSIWMIEWSWCGGRDPKPPTTRAYPFFYRTVGDQILFPPAGFGFQWWPEVHVARQLGWKFKIHGGYVWHPTDTELYPFDWIPDLYQKRARLKAAGKDGAQRILKYGLNSLYGKLCQASGSVKDKPPRFHQLAMAGWITSYTRAKILEAASHNYDSVLFQMTDSVVGTERLPLDEGTGLGQWEIEEYEAGLVVQAGVGSLWKDGVETAKYRGFDKGAITSDGILSQWRANSETQVIMPLHTEVTRPITLGSALITAKRFEEWGLWKTANRDLHIYGGDGKRMPSGPLSELEPWHRFEPLTPTPLAITVDGKPVPGKVLGAWLDQRFGDALSAVYKPKWAKSDPWSLPLVTGRLRDDLLETDVEVAGL